MLTLQFAIATHRPEGIQRVAQMVLPPIEGVGYVVSWQAHENAPIPQALVRPDIEIYRLDETGQSKNRNNAYSKCSADIIVSSDDDLTLYPAGIHGLIKAFEENPDVDFATFRSDHGDPSRFPAENTPLRRPLPKGYYVTGFEMAFRQRVASRVRCCEELGLGSAKFHGGEDEMLLQSAIMRGLNCRFFPITVCSHPHLSTGLQPSLSDSNLRAMGAVIGLTYPHSKWPRAILKAWRICRAGQASLIKSIFRIAQGTFEARALLRRNPESLW